MEGLQTGLSVYWLTMIIAMTGKKQKDRKLLPGKWLMLAGNLQNTNVFTM